MKAYMLAFISGDGQCVDSLEVGSLTAALEEAYYYIDNDGVSRINVYHGMQYITTIEKL